MAEQTTTAAPAEPYSFIRHIAGTAVESIPALDSSRVTFQISGSSDAPDEWATVTGNYGNFESYEPEYEEDEYIAYLEGCEAKQMLIDGVVVFNREFTVYQERECQSPLNEKPPTDSELYAEYVAIQTGETIKAAALKIHENLTAEQRNLVSEYLRAVCVFHNMNNQNVSAIAVQESESELRFAKL